MMKQKTREMLIKLEGYALGAKALVADYNTGIAFEEIATTIRNAVDEETPEEDGEEDISSLMMKVERQGNVLAMYDLMRSGEITMDGKRMNIKEFDLLEEAEDGKA